MKIGVIGAGTMGSGIAHVFSLYQYKVKLIDVNNQILDLALEKIKKNLNRQVNKSIITSNQAQKSINFISLSTKLEDLYDCDLVIEAVIEDLEIKKKLFNQLDNLCKKDTIIASNTSSISINKLAESTGRPEKIIGMHFMNPVHIMKLVEIIKGIKTSSNTLNTIKSLSKLIGKIPVECNDSPGFISNRILMPMINEAAYAYMEGVASIESIDQIMKLGMGHPMGPLKLADLIGIDVCVYIMGILQQEFKNKKYNICPLLTDMVKEGKLGTKSGEGFYKY